MRQHQAGGIGIQLNQCDMFVYVCIPKSAEDRCLKRVLAQPLGTSNYVFICACTFFLIRPLHIGSTPQAADFSNRYIRVCLSVHVSNGVESDSDCQSSHMGCEIESKMELQKAVHMPPLF